MCTTRTRYDLFLLNMQEKAKSEQGNIYKPKKKPHCADRILRDSNRVCFMCD